MTDTLHQSAIDAMVASEELDETDLHIAFADERRRRTLDVVTDRSPPVDAETLATAVAAREAGARPSTVASDHVDRVHRMLYHVHLPKLAETSLIEYDADDACVDGYADALESIPVAVERARR